MTIPNPEFYTNPVVSTMTFTNSEAPVSSPSETDSSSPTNLNDSTVLNSMDLQQGGLSLDDGLLDPKSGKVKKSSLSSAERRATHNAIERARRESLNGRFMALAEALPSMAHVKRPSKSIIVNKSLEYINESLLRERYLAKENLDLRREVDELRQRLGMPALPPPPPHLVSALHAQQPQPRSPSITSAMVSQSPSVIVSGPIPMQQQPHGVSAAEFAAAVQAQNQAAVAAQAGYRAQIPTLLAQRGQNLHFGLTATPHPLFHDPAHGLTTAALLSPAAFHPNAQTHPFDNPATAQLYSTTGQLFGAAPMLSAPVIVGHPNGANPPGVFDASFAGNVNVKTESDEEKRESKKPSTSGSELKSPIASNTPDSTSSFISSSPPVTVAQQQQQIAASLGIDFNAQNQNGIWGVKSQNTEDVLSSSVSSEGSRRGSIPQPQANWYGLSLEANNSSAYGLFA